MRCTHSVCFMTLTTPTVQGGVAPNFIKAPETAMCSRLLCVPDVFPTLAQCASPLQSHPTPRNAAPRLPSDLAAQQANYQGGSSSGQQGNQSCSQQRGHLAEDR